MIENRAQNCQSAHSYICLHRKRQNGVIDYIFNNNMVILGASVNEFANHKNLFHNVKAKTATAKLSK